MERVRTLVDINTAQAPLSIPARCTATRKPPDGVVARVSWRVGRIFTCHGVPYTHLREIPCKGPVRLETTSRPVLVLAKHQRASRAQDLGVRCNPLPKLFPVNVEVSLGAVACIGDVVPLVVRGTLVKVRHSVRAAASLADFAVLIVALPTIREQECIVVTWVSQRDHAHDVASRTSRFPPELNRHAAVVALPRVPARDHGIVAASAENGIAVRER
eukprot:1970981-Rhodomonas_salina.1